MFEFITDNIPNWVKHPIDTWNNWHPIDDAENSIKDYTKKKIQQGSEFALESAGVPTDMARSMVGDVPATTPTAGNNPTATAQQASDTKTTVGADGSVEIVNPDGSTRPKEKPSLIQNLLGMLGFGGGSEKSDDSKKDSWFGDLMSGIGSAVSGMFSNGIMGFIEGLIKLAVVVIGALIVKPAMSLLGGLFGGHHDGATADAGSTPAQGTGSGGMDKPQPGKPGVMASIGNALGNATDYVVDKWHATTEYFGAAPHVSRKVLRYAEQYDVAGIEERHHLAHGTLLAIMDNESRGVEGRVSKTGAQGLMQFMPDTAKRFGIDPNDPKQALEGAATYMETLSKQFNGDQRAMFAAYNAGEGRIQHYTDGKATLPEETKHYVARAIALMPSYGEATVAIADAKAHNGSEAAALVADNKAHPGNEDAARRAAAALNANKDGTVTPVVASNITVAQQYQLPASNDPQATVQRAG